MTLYDSSVLIDYLDGVDSATGYVENNYDERTVTIPLVMFEVYQGEVFKSGRPDFAAVEDALDWLTVVAVSPTMARDAAELQASLADNGDPLAARDAFIAGAAESLGERLVTADRDFDVESLVARLDVEFC